MNNEIRKIHNNKAIKSLFRKRLELKTEIIHISKKLNKALEASKYNRRNDYKFLEANKIQDYEKFIKIYIILKS